jgi:hypothetical protein
MQGFPRTWDFVEQRLAGRRLNPASALENVHAGVMYLGHLLRETGFDERQAAAAYYQGLGSVRRIGMLPDTRRYVADVMALRARYGPQAIAPSRISVGESQRLGSVGPPRARTAKIAQASWLGVVLRHLGRTVLPRERSRRPRGRAPLDSYPARFHRRPHSFSPREKRGAPSRGQEQTNVRDNVRPRPRI